MKTDVVFQSKNKETEENTLNFFVQSMYFSIFWYLLEEKFDFVKSIQNSYLQQNQNVHHNNMLPSPHHSNSQHQQQNSMRSPQGGGMMGRPPNLPVAGVGRMPPQQHSTNTAASFLAYSAGDVPSTVQNRNQQQQHLNQSANLSQNSTHGNNSQHLQKMSTNQAMGESNSYSNYNSNMSLLNASSSSSKTSSSVLDPSRNATTQDRYKGKASHK